MDQPGKTFLCISNFFKGNAFLRIEKTRKQSFLVHLRKIKG
jgi:hypothetical protein